MKTKTTLFILIFLASQLLFGQSDHIEITPLGYGKSAEYQLVKTNKTLLIDSKSGAIISQIKGGVRLQQEYDDRYITYREIYGDKKGVIDLQTGYDGIKSGRLFS